MSRWKTTAAVMIIFVLGIAFGLALALWWVPQSGIYEPTVRDILAQRVHARMTNRLHLSAAQEQAISGIIEETRGQLQQIGKETRPRIRHTLRTARAKIRAQLNAAQQAKFDAMLKTNPRFHPLIGAEE